MNDDLQAKYNTIYDHVKMRDALTMYFEPTNADRGRCRCPFHNGHDRNFSYSNVQYQCWVCGAKGNTITFVANLFGISNYEAAKKLSADFCLGVMDTDYKVPKSESRYLRKQKTQTEYEIKRKEELDEEYRKLTDLYHSVKDAVKELHPKSEEEITDEYAAAVHFLTTLEYKINKLYQEITQC